MTKNAEKETTQVTINELATIQIVLRNVLLPVEGTGLSYEITKNLIVIDKVLKEKHEQEVEINKQFLFKDDKKVPLQYAVKPLNGKDVYDLRDGKFIVIDKEVDKITATQPMVNRQNPEFIEAYQKLTTDIHIAFEKFDNRKMTTMYKKGKFENIDLTPLHGFLFELE